MNELIFFSLKRYLNAYLLGQLIQFLSGNIGAVSIEDDHAWFLLTCYGIPAHMSSAYY
jgi:hypothetical protein